MGGGGEGREIKRRAAYFISPLWIHILHSARAATQHCEIQRQTASLCSHVLHVKVGAVIGKYVTILSNRRPQMLSNYSRGEKMLTACPPSPHTKLHSLHRSATRTENQEATSCDSFVFFFFAFFILAKKLKGGSFFTENQNSR